jgi:hypothetical protein
MDVVIQQCKLASKAATDDFYVFRKADCRFEERWGKNQLVLANTLSGNLAYFLLMLVKSPRNMRDGLLRRFYRRKNSNALFMEGFFSVLAHALGEYFDKPTRKKNLMRFLTRLDLPKSF